MLSINFGKCLFFIQNGNGDYGQMVGRTDPFATIGNYFIRFNILNAMDILSAVFFAKVT